MDLHLTGKRALITGASKGIGRAAAQMLGAEGCDLILVARDERRLAAARDELVEQTGRAVRSLPADLSRASEVSRVAAAVDHLDILVNNAGAIPAGSLQSVTEDAWRTAWDLKVFGYIGLCRALYPVLQRRSGVIVNVIGCAGEMALPDYIAGASGNAALMAFTRSLGKAAPAEGMRVVGINPGPVATDRHESLRRAMALEQLGDAERWRELSRGMPFDRAARPEEIAAAVAFLASPLSGYTSGAILTINGGIS